MSTPLSAPQLLEQEFLVTRCKILEVAAALDRLGRCEGSVNDDRRVALIQKALDVLQDNAPDKAERIQLVFSLPHEEGWLEDFERSV